MNSFLLQIEEENVQKGKIGSELGFLDFRERECAFSLDFPPFGPSVLDGARSKVELRGKGYAWAPIIWISNNSKR